MATDTAPEALFKLQTGFAAHIRDPQASPAPDGIEDRRMAIYRDLFFNNVRSFLSANFPVLHSLFDTQGWDALCRDFYRDFRCQTPLFPEIPREFLRYLQECRTDRASDMPFMLELAHYEWVELALSLDETETAAFQADPDGDLLAGIPLLSPLAWPLSYQFPVHRICADYQPASAPDTGTHLLVWRRADFTIHFMQLNEFSAVFLQRLKDNRTHTGLELLTAIASESGHSQPQVLIEGGRSLMRELRDKQVIAVTRYS